MKLIGLFTIYVVLSLMTVMVGNVARESDIINNEQFGLLLKYNPVINLFVYMKQNGVRWQTREERIISEINELDYYISREEERESRREAAEKKEDTSCELL